MGMKDWLNKIQKKAEDALKPEPTDPEAIRQKKREDAAKTVDRTAKAIKLAKKGLDGYKATADKVEEITKDVAQKTVVVAEMAKPLAEKVDQALEGVGEQTKGLLGGLGEKAMDAFKSVKGKPKAEAESESDEAPKKPSTGSTLLDMIAPAVPETDATSPKQDDVKKPKDTPPQP